MQKRSTSHSKIFTEGGINMKRITKAVLVLVFFGLIAASLASYVLLICYPDNPYAASVQRAFLAEGGQDDEVIVVAWAQGKSLWFNKGRVTGNGGESILSQVCALHEAMLTSTAVELFAFPLSYHERFLRTLADACAKPVAAILRHEPGFAFDYLKRPLGTRNHTPAAARAAFLIDFYDLSSGLRGLSPFAWRLWFPAQIQYWGYLRFLDRLFTSRATMSRITPFY
jgi:hypothetical protein